MLIVRTNAAVLCALLLVAGGCSRKSGTADEECALDCRTAIPDGLGRCVDGDTTARCVVDRCNPGFVAVSQTECVAAPDLACQPCSDDAGCFGGRCVDELCLPACAGGASCPDGYTCATDGSELCRPTSGSCDCLPANHGHSRPCSAATTAGTCPGTETCDAASGWSACTALPPTDEVCNGLDDDCDGLIDAEDDLGGDPAVGVTCQGDPDGECALPSRAGTTACVDGEVVCAGPEVRFEREVQEVCNSLDDDCDGDTDEGTVEGEGDLCPSTNLGRCRGGIQGCEGGVLVCRTIPATDEYCNGLDDDCDGEVDEVCACADGETQACFSGHPGRRGKGLCADGVQTCVGGGWGPCVGDVLAAPEECLDMFDNDCDGAVDERCQCFGPGYMGCYSGPEATLSRGECWWGFQPCMQDEYGNDVLHGLCGADSTPKPEICSNWYDDDCDGITDEGCRCTYLRLAGVCVDAWRDPDTGDCLEPPGYEFPETLCDGLDNDCDGTTDEGC